MLPSPVGPRGSKHAPGEAPEPLPQVFGCGPWEQSICKEIIPLEKPSGHLDPVHGINPSGCFLLLPASRPPALTQDLSIGHTCCSFGTEGKEGGGHRRGHFPPLILVSPPADEPVFKFPEIHLSLQTQPTFLVPWPLAVMNFIVKEQFCQVHDLPAEEARLSLFLPQSRGTAGPRTE